jgi:hypothetical protein
MKVKWGALMVDGRGKIGGQVASKNRNGAYMRTKVSPVNRKTSAQTLVRSRLAGFSQGWAGLTQAQREAWNAAVTNFQKSNIFGDLVKPTGFNLYQRLNNNIAIGGGTAITTPPLLTSVTAFTSLSANAAAGTPAVTLTYAPAIPAAEYVKVFATAGQSAGKSFVKSEFRLIGTLVTANASPFALLSLYTAKFGSVPSAGKQIFFRCVFVNKTGGFVGQSRTTSCVVAA